MPALILLVKKEDLFTKKTHTLRFLVSLQSLAQKKYSENNYAACNYLCSKDGFKNISEGVKTGNTYRIFEKTNKMGYSPGLYHHPGLQGVARGDVGQGPGSLEEHRIGLLLVRRGYAQKGHQFWN